ncbi:MAG: lipid-A-disaccharide synthase [Xanthobacteraceae bacterium]
MAASDRRSGEAARLPLVYVVAAEESGDRLGAALMKAIRAQAGPEVVFEGVGGREMAARGLRSLFPIEDMAIMGLGLVTAIPRLVRRMRKTAASIVSMRPDVLVLIDSPDFTHRVARSVRRAAPAIPIVNYVSPSVWAWRPGRARSMRSYVDHVLALLPFEPEAHVRLGGPPCTYVGHSAIERLAEFRPSAQEATRRSIDPPILLVLPGSRTGEIRRLTGVFGEAIGVLQARCGPFDLVLPTLPHLAGQIAEATAAWPVRPRILVDHVEKQAALRTARAALAKSGTVTLELALAGVPMVVAYKVSLVEEIVARLSLDVPSIVLANLVLGENVVPEILQRDCTAPNLANKIEPLLHDTPQRRRQIDAFARLDTIMEIGKAIPSQRAAEVVLRYAAQGRVA